MWTLWTTKATTIRPPMNRIAIPPATIPSIHHMAALFCAGAFWAAFWRGTGGGTGVADIRHLSLIPGYCTRERSGMFPLRVLGHARSGEANFYVGALLEMHGVNEPDLALIQSQDQRLRARAFAEEPDAAQQASFGDACAGEDDSLSGREVLGVVDAFRIFYAHLGETLVVLRFGNHETGEDLTVQAAQCGRGQDAFGSAAGAHDGVDACANDRRGTPGGQGAVADQADARAGGANLGDELFVARAIENDDDEVFEVAVEALGDGAKIVGDRGVKIDRAFARRPDDNFFHVEIGRVEQAAFFAGGENGDGIRRAGGAEIRAFERIDGDIHGGIEAVLIA